MRCGALFRWLGLLLVASNLRPATAAGQGAEVLLRLCRSSSPIPGAVSRLCAELEAAAAPPRFPQLWPELVGDWRLLYSNNALRASLRGVEVVQRIELVDPADLSFGQVQHILRGKLLPLEVRLIHSARVTSESSPAQLSIDLDQLRLGALPPAASLLPGGLLRRGFFDTTYIDEEVRVSRGLLGELRVFQRLADGARSDR